MGKSISKGFRSIAKGLTGGGGTQGGASVPPPVAPPDDAQQAVVDTQGQETEGGKTMSRGKSGLNISRTSGGGLSL
ncbi:hypothetical protein EO873_19875 [Shigella flexneri]|nr:tail assembly protein [Shigella flexneri G1663]AZG51064.1 hypothetical protein EGX88_14280 [Shigella flexneri]EFN8166803.1 hypothetical protein [Escherichia coli]EFN8430946.1 hypothetical protein [Escherichia coli O68]EFO0930105.1 hypothetical protein [Escherichia coli O157]EFY7897582.1 hypothetical protein [Shigella sonnei]ODQ21377.1 hypothetical protein BGK53_19605 [Shigella sp. FC1139]